ncbi:MAG: TetR/AcrR family transcriptional regulator [Bacillota bacterium]|jgi:AcrR family transcriptional regulator
MDDIIQNIDPDKRDRIINAAIKEFASVPYEKASTNNIVKNAGISKGLLFHYFSSKKELYEVLISFVIHTLRDAIIEKINWEETDLFERLKQATIVKLEVSRVYPHMFDFMKNIVAYKNTGSMESLFEMYKGYGLDLEQIYNDFYTRNVDYSRFRDPSIITETINIVRWSLEKYTEEQLLTLGEDNRLDYNQAATDLSHYVDILKDAFYS